MRKQKMKSRVAVNEEVFATIHDGVGLRWMTDFGMIMDHEG